MKQFGTFLLCICTGGFAVLHAQTIEVTPQRVMVGHRAGRPAIVPEWHGTLRQPVSAREENYGGTPEGDAQPSIDAISKVLAFVRRALQNGPAQP